MATTLSSGDLAIIGVNSDDPDAFNFVLFTDIEADTEIFFTDNGVFSDGSFRQNEGVIKYTAPSDVAAGTVVEFTGIAGGFTTESGSFALSASGDQVIAYQGNVDNPDFIYAVQTNSTEFQADATSSNNSALPPGLSVGTTAVAVGSSVSGEFDNSTYNESVTSGTQTELLAAISDAANWNGSNTRIPDLADGPFTVTDSNGGGTPDLKINELRISSSGASDEDSNFVEIFGESGTALEGVSLVVLSGEFEPGQVDFAFDLSGRTIDQDNLILVANPGISNVIPQAVTEDNDLLTEFDLFGSPSTFLLVQDFTGVQGDDLDVNDDGILDQSIGTVIDSVSLIDGDSNIDQNYSDTVIGPSGSFTPAGIARNQDGTGDFEQLAFGSEADDTPGTSNVVDPPVEVTPIYEIQGAAQISPLEGQSVTTEGIVTAVDSNGFYLQDATGDSDVATSDGIFVFTSSNPSVSVGEAVQVSGTVSEFIPGGASTGNLSITQISGSPTVTTLSQGNSLPTPVILGVDRIPPSQTIDDDLNRLYNVLEGEGIYQPTEDGIDFYESLEGMRVTVNQPLAVAPTTRFGEIFTVVNDGANATNISDRTTINISPNDFNPERVQIDSDAFTPGDIPLVDTGAELNNVTGVVSYSFGNFEVLATEAVTVSDPSSLTPESSELAPTETGLTVASYNVLNLDPNDGDGDTDIANGRFEAIANDIVNNLNLPDIVALQEIQDNDGSTNSEITAADETLNFLIAEIAETSGVEYEFIDNPFIGDDTSGGQPGGNIRTAFLYNPDRVSLAGDPLLDQPFQGAVQTVVDPQDQQTNPDNPFFNTRLPLVGFFTFNGEEVVVVNNHFSSKGGSSPLFGALQPAVDFQEDPTINGDVDERRQQALAVKAYIEDLSNDNIVALGDFNEFEFISPLDLLEETLINLTETLPPDERYSFIFQGNSQALDHILVSEALADTAEFDAVHLNAEFAETSERASDHDPLLARFTIEMVEPEPNRIRGSRGDDRIRGTNGNDLITGDNGDDTINGAQGDDTIEGGRGGDIIRGGAGDDVLAADRVDRFNDFDGSASELRGDNGDDTIFGGRKDDFLGGGNGDDLLLGKDGDDLIIGAGGDDTLNGGVGDDTLRGQAGVDTADYSDLSFGGISSSIAGVDVNLDQNQAIHSSTNNALSWTDTLTTIENVVGSSRNDRFVGNRRDNLFDGGDEVGRRDRQTQFTAANGETYRVIGDVVEYGGSQSDFTFVGTADSFTATASGIGIDILIDIEFVRFNADSAVIATADLTFV